MHYRQIIYIFFFALLLNIIFFTTTNTGQAQINDLNIANYVPLDDQTAKEGMIVSRNGDRFFLAKANENNEFAGIIVSVPAIAFNFSNNIKTVPIVDVGGVKILVSEINGPITKGAKISFSKIPGIGATASGNEKVIATALENFYPQNNSEIGLIECYILLENFQPQTFYQNDQLINSTIGTMKSIPPTSAHETWRDIKYIMAVLVLVISMIFGFFTFGRIASNGITAIGSNPLARRYIIVAITFNTAMATLIVAIGATIAFLFITI
jgi:hypothetical protein